MEELNKFSRREVGTLPRKWGFFHFEFVLGQSWALTRKHCSILGDTIASK